MVELEFRMLGPLEVWRGNGPVALPPGRPRALLGLLLLEANTVVTTERILDELWRGTPPRTAAHAVQVYVANLRKLLESGRDPGGSAVLATRKPGYLLVVPPEQCDARRFEGLAARAGTALDEGRAETAAELYAEALALWRGPVLADLVDEPFVAAEATRLEELRLVVTERQVEAELKLGRHAQLTGDIEKLVQQHPLRERLWAHLMVALYRSGRQADALAAYQRLRTILGEQLGLEPAPELRHLERAILGHDAGLAWVAPGGEQRGQPGPRDAAGVPLPGRLRARPAMDFVGREPEQRHLADRFAAAATGEGRQVVLLQGEPGMGKTTLAAKFAASIHSAGATVLYGRCEEGLRAPYQPFVEALSHCVQHTDAEVLGGWVGDHAGELSGLIPALARRLPTVLPSRSSDPDTQRYLVFSGVAQLLAAASAVGPILLVLDDLHWADDGSLLLLRHLVGADAEMRLFVLATYRASDLPDAPALEDTLAALWRHDGVERLDLVGLDDTQVAALVESTTGRPSGEALTVLAHHVGTETGGNPFYVLEVVRHLHEQGLLTGHHDGPPPPTLDKLGMPQTLRDVVGQRVARLGVPAGDLLRHAAAVGREFDVDLLAAATGVPEADVVDLLESAAAAALVVSDAPRRYSFAHAVIRYTLYDALSPTRRQLAHRRIAEALEHMHGLRPGPRVAELAHHWLLGAGPADATKALGYAQAAGHAALARLAFEDAVRWFSHALELLDQATLGDELRADLLIGLGSAQRLAGDPGHRETLLAAARLAMELSDTDRLVRAALTNSRGAYSAMGTVDNDRIEVLQAALAATSGDSRERALLLAVLCCEQLFVGDWPYRQALAAEARTMARRLGDPETFLRVVHLTYDATTVPETLEERRALSAESLSLAERVTDPVIRHGIYRYHLVSSADVADIDSFDRDLELLTAAAVESGDPWLKVYPSFFSAWRALLAGRLDEAEAWTAEFLQVALQGGFGDEARFYHAWMLLDIRRHQDRLVELEDYFVGAARELERLTYLRAVLALLYTDIGKTTEAARILADTAAGDFADLRYDPCWLYGMTSYAEVAVRLVDVDAARRIYGRLAPFDTHFAFMWWSTGGSVALYLGMLATTLGHFEEAGSHFRSALVVHERLDAPYWVARTHLETARMLLARRSHEDCEQAGLLLDQADAAAAKGGFAVLRRQAAEVRRLL